jgi:hypothetical protein
MTIGTPPAIVTLEKSGVPPGRFLRLCGTLAKFRRLAVDLQRDDDGLVLEQQSDFQLS